MTERTQSKPGKIRRWTVRVIRFGLAVLLLAVLIDFGYSRYVALKMSAWEKSIDRDEHGVIKGGAAFDSGDPAQPTAVLLVHGLNDTAKCYRRMAPRLSRAGYFCRSMRLPGFGETTELYGKSTSREWIESVTAEVDRLKQNHKRVFVVAHSLGAATAIAALLEEKVSVDGIALLAPAIETSNKRAPIFSARFYHELGNRILIFTKIVQSPYGNDCSDPELRNPPDKIRFVARQTVDELYRLIDANRGKGNRLQLPVLVVIPGNDKIVDNDATRVFFESLKSRHKKWQVQEKARHSLPYDYGWEEVTDWIVDFIKSVPANP